MLTVHAALAVCLAVQVSGQLFGGPMLRFGFDFPGFAAPEAFEDQESAGLPGKMEELLTGMTKARPGVKTKVKTQHKGDENITTVEQKGKGFDSWSRLTTFGDGKKSGGKSFSKMVSNIFGGGGLGGLAGLTRREEKSKRKSECSGQKPCHQDSYCDPIEGTCKPRLPEGGSCFFKDQCRKTNNVLCIWGRCSPGTAGQPGTYCKNKGDCIAETYCTEDSQFSVFHAICKPRLSEGASCGNVNPLGGMFKIFLGKREAIEKDEPNPCRDNLKCERVGFFGGMVCVPQNLVTKPAKEETLPEKEETETEEKVSSGGDEDTDEKEDNNEGGDIVTSEQKENPEEQKPQVGGQQEKGEQEEENPEEQKPQVGGQQEKGGQEEEEPKEEQEEELEDQPTDNQPEQQPKIPDLGQKKPDNTNLPYPPPAKDAENKKSKKAKKAKKGKKGKKVAKDEKQN